MRIGILKEPPYENRVAFLPEHVGALVKMQLEVLVEKTAGEGARASDKDYGAAGASVAERKQVLADSDALVQINALDAKELSALKKGQVLLNVAQPLFNKEMVNASLQQGVTLFSMDTVPRISRAQSMDILSSMATVAGYKAVLEAAMYLPRFFPMFMTAAGTIKPAKVVILGAGVAGLQAISTARRLGAVVEVFDVRAAAKEEVKSLGAKFIEVQGAKEDESAGGYAVEQSEEYKKKQQELVQEHAQKADVIITTAQIPGKKAPLLVPAASVEKMKPGSVIVDLAASTGGNCELTKNDEVVVHNDVRIIGKSNYPSELPVDASQMFGKNLINFLKLIVSKEGDIQVNMDDDVVKGTCITHQGEITNQRVKENMES